MTAWHGRDSQCCADQRTKRNASSVAGWLTVFVVVQPTKPTQPGRQRNEYRHIAKDDGHR